MSGRGNKKQSINSIEKRKWLLGVYTRRSFDDGEREESYTITNQKKLIENFLKEKNYSDVVIEDYYIDDGYTGTNFDRPAFKKLMQDVVNGRINGIIVKDLSRLGRNHKEAGKYIEEIFPIYDLRIIAVNDNVDSYLDPESIRSLMVPIKNLMNENYSRDLSKKVASAYETMAKSGQYVAGTPPYGYMIDPDDKHHLIIEPSEAIIVRKIFDMALEGNGRIKICKYLNESGILCRKEIQRRKKRKLTLEPFDIESRYLWGTTTIGRLLSSETYIGNLEQLKTKRASFGVEKYVTKDKDEWIKSINTHEPLITREEFEKVQQTIRHNTKSKSDPTNYSIFRGILKCADCGRAMTKQEDHRGNRDISNYFCMNYLTTSKQCSPHKIKTSILEKAVLESIQLQVKLVIELERSMNKLFFKNNKDSLENEYKNNVRIAEMKINNLKEQKRESYEQWKFNEIDKEEFDKTSNNIDLKIKQYESDIELYTSTYRETIKKIRKNDYWIGHYKRNRRIKSLSKTVLNELIDVIYVTEDGRVDIKFKYQDEYVSLVNYLESEGVIHNEEMVNRNVFETVC